jgi:DNA-binding IclR family transcriptional regulator
MVEIPESPAARLELVAKAIWGDDPGWRFALAKRLGVGRTTLYRILADRKRPAKPLDSKLLALLAAERKACHQRGRDIARLEQRLADTFDRGYAADRIRRRLP